MTTTTVDIARRAVQGAGAKDVVRTKVAGVASSVTSTKEQVSSLAIPASSEDTSPLSTTTTSTSPSPSSSSPQVHSDTEKDDAKEGKAVASAEASEAPKRLPAIAMTTQLPSLSELIPPPDPHPEYHNIIGRLKSRHEQAPVQSSHLDSYATDDQHSPPQFRDEHFAQRQPLPYAYVRAPVSSLVTMGSQPPLMPQSLPQSPQHASSREQSMAFGTHPLKVVPRYDMGRTLPQLGHMHSVAPMLRVALTSPSLAHHATATHNEAGGGGGGGGGGASSWTPSEVFNTQQHDKLTATSPERYSLRPLSSAEQAKARAVHTAEEHKEEMLRRLQKRNVELNAQLGPPRLNTSAFGTNKTIDHRLLPVPLHMQPDGGGSGNGHHRHAGPYNVSQATHETKHGVAPPAPPPHWQQQQHMPLAGRALVSCPKKAERPFHNLPVVRYECPEDPRGFVEVYKCVIKDANVFVDVDSSFVHISGICKALGPENNMTEQLLAIPELRHLCTVINEGDAQLHGIWAPFETAWAICTFMAYWLRYALAPLFGDKFPSACLTPSEKGYGHLRAALAYHPDFQVYSLEAPHAPQQQPSPAAPSDSTLTNSASQAMKATTAQQGTNKPGKRRQRITVTPETPSAAVSSVPTPISHTTPRRKTTSEAKSGVTQQSSTSSDKNGSTLSEDERKQAVSEYHAMQLISSKTTSIKRKRASTSATPATLGRPRKHLAVSPSTAATKDAKSDTSNSSSRAKKSPLQLQYAGPHLAQAGLCIIGSSPCPQAQETNEEEREPVGHDQADIVQRGHASKDAPQRDVRMETIPHRQKRVPQSEAAQKSALKNWPFLELREADDWDTPPQSSTTHTLPPPPSTKSTLDMSNVAAAMSRPAGQAKSGAETRKESRGPLQNSSEVMPTPYKQSPFGTRSIPPPTPTQAKAHGQAQVQANEVLIGRRATVPQQHKSSERAPHGQASMHMPTPMPPKQQSTTLSDKASWRLAARRLYDASFPVDKVGRATPSSLMSKAMTAEQQGPVTPPQASPRPLHERPVQPQQVSTIAQRHQDLEMHGAVNRVSLNSLARAQEESWAKSSSMLQGDAAARPLATQQKGPHVSSSPLSSTAAVSHEAVNTHSSSPIRSASGPEL